MYHNSYQFGKAYQEEMLREAGVKDVQEIEGIIQNQAKGEGLLRRMIGGLFARKQETKPAPSISVQKANRSFGG